MLRTKPILRNNQQGIAMMIAIMVLSLGGSIALIAFRSSTQELAFSHFTEYEVSAQYLAESGVDQVLSWVRDPASFPASHAKYLAVRDFLGDLPTKPCLNNSDNPDQEISEASFLAGTEGPFSELKGMGNIKEIKFYAPLRPHPPLVNDPRLCTLEVTASSGKGAIRRIRVDLASNSIGPITAGIQGVVTTSDALPIWVHWGEIHYTAASEDGPAEANLGTQIVRVPRHPRDVKHGDLEYNDKAYDSDPADYDDNSDLDLKIFVEQIIAPAENGDSFSEKRENVFQESSDALLDKVDPDDSHQEALSRFLKENGEIYTLSSEDGKIEKNGETKTFDELFCIPRKHKNPKTHLVWIVSDDDSSGEPLPINCGRYKGYFFFSGNISISGRHPTENESLGTVVSARDPKGGKQDLRQINLEGLFYTNGSIEVQTKFKAYGAVFSRGGFTGAETQNLRVWYNSDFGKAHFPGIRPVTPLRGTWATLPSENN